MSSTLSRSCSHIPLRKCQPWKFANSLEEKLLNDAHAKWRTVCGGDVCVCVGGGGISEGLPVASPCHHLRSHLQRLSPSPLALLPPPQLLPLTSVEETKTSGHAVITPNLPYHCQSCLHPPSRAAAIVMFVILKLDYSWIYLYQWNLWKNTFPLQSATIYSFTGGLRTTILTILLPYLTCSIFKLGIPEFLQSKR